MGRVEMIEQKVEKPTEKEDSFREALRDVAAVLQKLAPLCRTVEEATGLVKLGLDNDAQLRILMMMVTGRPS